MGAYMAQDIGLIWPKEIKGVGFIGAGPYSNEGWIAKDEGFDNLFNFYVKDKTPL